jgi:hypothetical protein
MKKFTQVKIYTNVKYENVLLVLNIIITHEKIHNDKKIYTNASVPLQNI